MEDFMRQTVEVSVAELQGFCDEMTEMKHESNLRGAVRRRASHQGGACARARPVRCEVFRDDKCPPPSGKMRLLNRLLRCG